MRVTTMCAALAALAVAGSALAQGAPPAAAPPPAKLFTSNAELEALIANAKANIKPGATTFSQPLLRYAPYAANLEYLTADGTAAVHEKDTELLFVVRGGGSLTTGGKLAGETRLNAANLRGTAIEGGESRKVGRGDSILLPPGTPHRFTAIEDGALVMISLHLPGAG